MNLLGIVGIGAAVLAGAVAGWFLNNRFGRKSLEATRKRSDETIRNARREADKTQRAAVLEAKQEILAQRNKADRDLRSRRGQIQKRERDLKKGVEALQEQEAGLARREEEIADASERLVVREREIEVTREQVDQLARRSRTTTWSAFRE